MTLSLGHLRKLISVRMTVCFPQSLRSQPRTASRAPLSRGRLPRNLNATIVGTHYRYEPSPRDPVRVGPLGLDRSTSQLHPPLPSPPSCSSWARCIVSIPRIRARQGEWLVRFQNIAVSYRGNIRMPQRMRLDCIATRLLAYRSQVLLLCIVRRCQGSDSLCPRERHRGIIATCRSSYSDTASLRLLGCSTRCSKCERGTFLPAQSARPHSERDDKR